MSGKLPFGLFSSSKRYNNCLFYPRRALFSARGHAIWLRRRRHPPGVRLNLSPASCNTSLGLERVGIYPRRVCLSVNNAYVFTVQPQYHSRSLRRGVFWGRGEKGKGRETLCFNSLSRARYTLFCSSSSTCVFACLVFISIDLFFFLLF